MNARTLLPLAILTVVSSAWVTASAADNPAPPGAALPDSKAQAKARAALYADDPVPTESAPKAAAAAATTTEEKSVTEATAAAPAAAVTLAGAQPDNEAQAKARAALYANEPGSVSLDGVQPDTETQAKARMALSAVEPAPTVAAATPQATVTNPLAAGMAAPALPTDAAQQQQLNALLQQYRSDQISASQYHGQRAEILAGK